MHSLLREDLCSLKVILNLFEAEVVAN